MRTRISSARWPRHMSWACRARGGRHPQALRGVLRLDGRPQPCPRTARPPGAVRRHPAALRTARRRGCGVGHELVRRDRRRGPAASEWLLTSVLRDRWGFEGTVVSDYWSLPFLVNAHRVAADLPAAGALALRAGMDVELPDQRGFGEALVSAVEKGRWPRARSTGRYAGCCARRSSWGCSTPAGTRAHPPCAPGRSTSTNRSTVGLPTRSPGRAPCC